LLAASIAWLWHSDAAFELKATALALASLLATPYAFDYEISLLAAAWLVPLLSRGVAGATGVPLGLMVMLALYGFVLRRAVHDHAIANEKHRLAQA
jgi:alpha-1,2-mannosyltransferase